jgi:hypothetical protein
MNGFEIRGYRPSDEEGIVRFLQFVFDGWPNFDLNCSSLEHWRWKYLDNPTKQSFVAVALSNNEMIGVNHAYPIKIKIGGKVFPCGYASDTAVHPKFRRMGVYKRIIDLKNSLESSEGRHLNLSVTSNPIMVKSNLRNPIMEPFPHKIFNLVKIKDLDLHLRHIPVNNPRFIRLGYRAANLLNKLNSSWRNKSTNMKIEVNSINKFDKRINLFNKTISDQYDFMVDRNVDYLNWRYCDHRVGKFTVRQVNDPEGKILGYSVLSLNNVLDNYPVGYIVDLMALPNRLDVVESLMEDAIHYFDSRDVNIINSLMPGKHPYHRIFERHGFLNSRIQIQLFCNYYVMGEAKNLIESTQANAVHFSFGDVDSLPTRMPQNIL